MSLHLKMVRIWTFNSRRQCIQVAVRPSSMNVAARGALIAVAATIPELWCQSIRKMKAETWSLRISWSGTLLSTSLLSSSSLQVIGPPSRNGIYRQTMARQPSGLHSVRTTLRSSSHGHPPTLNTCQTQGSSTLRSMTSLKHSTRQLIFLRSTLRETVGKAVKVDSKS